MHAPHLSRRHGAARHVAKAANSENTLIRNLRFAAERFRSGRRVRLLIEPLNTRDVPGYFISRADEAASLIDAVGSDNLWLQYDLYHGHAMGDDLAATLRRHIGRIFHIQLADDPGRHEPGTGTIDFPPLLSLLDELGYGGLGRLRIPARHDDRGQPRPGSGPI